MSANSVTDKNSGALPAAPMSAPEQNTPISSRPRFRNKTVATLLAALGGTFGAHRFYLQGRRALVGWLYPAYFVLVAAWALRYLAARHPDLGSDFITFLHPVLLAAFVPTAAGFVEALAFALTPDATWDDRWNRGCSQRNHSGALVIIIAIVTLAIGATGILSAIAISAQAYFEGTI